MSKIHELAFNAEEIDELLDSVDKKTIYQDATQSEHGLMSATDKSKLDALPTAQQIDDSFTVKVDKEEGKGLSTNDYTDADKAKVASALQSETDPTVPSWAKQPNKPSYDYSEIGNTPDLSGFITKSVNDLTNYYLKSETYTKAEVTALIGEIRQFHYEIYATLPQSGESNVLYLIGPTGSGSDKYEEYVYANNTFTKIGDTSIDLSGYVTTSTLNTALADYTTTANLTTLLAGKQDTISDLATIRSGAALGTTAYQKPQTGIPESDLSSDVQQALQEHFKGWYDSSSNLPSSPVVGDYAYVKGATSSDPAAIYECTTAGTWSDSGRTADTSNVQTFASGEEVNETSIDNTKLVNPSSSALALAKDVNEYISYPFSFDGSISNAGNYNSSSSYKLTDYIVIQGGEKYYGYGNSTTRGCVAFYDRNKTWISTLQPVSGSMTEYTLDENTIPANAVYFRAGTLGAYLAQSYIKQPVHSIAGNLDGFSKDIELVRNEVRKIDGYISSSDVTITNSQIKLNIAFIYDHAYIMVKCDTTPPSDTFKINRRTSYSNTVNTYLSDCRYNEWIRVDKDDVKGNIFYITADVSSSTVSIPMSIIFRSIEESIEDRLDLIENMAVGLKNKNIVVFGDSLSEFVGHGDNKSWVDHANEMTGANFINIAIGGTQLKQRYSKLPTLFDASKTYNVGDWVFYKPSTTMNCYECTAEHTGAWNGDNFSEVSYTSYLYTQLDIVSIVSAICNTSIVTYADKLTDTMACAQCIADHPVYGDDNTAQIQRLIDLDWSTVDAVVIMAGGNDFGVNSFGAENSTDKMVEAGAINEIVRMLSSTYKNIPIYYSSVVVRWFGYGEGTIAEENWCDVYHATAGSDTSELTYKGFVEAIMSQFKLHHIPVIDLYNTLGWNKWNFSEYFPTGESWSPSYDGTHPRKGFRQIAEKIVSFIIANRVF